ncbi:hypothetical protein JXJ21_21240 [candidate division KSB1 bacterium]|nr:hypothetical protein [candidate division KSB1 bacterium]
MSTIKKPFLTPVQTIFLASMITADFAFGLAVKNLLAPTQILNIIRLDMVVPIMLMLVTRLIIDRFGVLILYEGVWGLFSVFAMPGAFGLPGFLKLIPALSQGIILDSLMSLMKSALKPRLMISSVLGGLLASIAFYALRFALGMPWSQFVQMIFGIQLLTGLVIWASGAVLTWLVWEKISGSQAVRRIQFVPES